MTNTLEKPEKSVPKYLHIYEDLRKQIQSGTLKPGDRLPSFSELRTAYDAMPATVDRTYARLERENLVVRQARRGVFVAERSASFTGNIGLIIHSCYPDFGPNSFAQIVLAGIRDGCREREMKIMLVEEDSAFNPQQVDGILFYGDMLEFYTLDIPSQMPQVMLLQHANDITSIAADDFGGFKLATSHLIKNGHHHIACLVEEVLSDKTILLRRGGYQAALQEAGIMGQPGWLRLAKKFQYAQMPHYQEWGYRNMLTWLNDGWHELNCTAIVVQNDHAAIGVIQALQEVGIDVPGEVSVMGFDGTDICDFVRPRLTSIEVPLRQIGYDAVNILCEQIKCPQQPREILLPVKLRAGDSVSQMNVERKRK